LYENDHTDADRKLMKYMVNRGIASAMRTLCEEALTGEERAKHSSVDDVEPESLAENKELILEFSKANAESLLESKLDSKTFDNIKTVWEDPKIRYIFDKFGQILDLPATTPYFMGKLDAIKESDYLPNDEDILKVRSRSTGAVKLEFTIEGSKFELYDVGGQKIERKKWLANFSHVRAILYVAAISEYDMVMWEDKSTNRLQDALDLFGTVVATDELKPSAVVLFLNKCDLFQEKFDKVPLSNYFPNFTGATLEDAYQFLAKEFINRNPYPHKDIYAHVTCAMDKRNVDIVFHSVKATVIRGGLDCAGLINN